MKYKQKSNRVEGAGAGIICEMNPNNGIHGRLVLFETSPAEGQRSLP